MNKEQLIKEIKKALDKGESWSAFTVSKKGHSFEIEYVYTSSKNAMSLEDVVIWKHGIRLKER